MTADIEILDEGLTPSARQLFGLLVDNASDLTAGGTIRLAYTDARLGDDLVALMQTIVVHKAGNTVTRVQLLAHGDVKGGRLRYGFPPALIPLIGPVRERLRV
jgi:hypothetical protein